MGAFLAINGLDIKIESESCTQQEVDQGSVYETQNGALLCPVARKIRTWSFTTSLLTLPELQAVKQWIFGQNVYWSFDQTLFSKYTGFSNAKTNPIPTYSTATPKFAGQYYGISAAGQAGPYWDVSALNWKKYEPYTVCGFGLNSAGTWDHWLHLSYYGMETPAAASYATSAESIVYKNAVLQATNLKANTPTVLSLADQPPLACVTYDSYAAGVTPVGYCDYALFKGCHLSTSMISALSSRTKRLQGFPYVAMSGEVVRGITATDPLVVIGRCDAEKFLYADGKQMGKLSFSLMDANLQPFNDLL